MSLWVRPARSRSSCTTGMRISTSLRRSSLRMPGDWAVATTAISLILRRLSQVLLEGLVVGVGLAGGLPVLDAAERRAQLVGPHSLDAQPHAHLFDGDHLDEA